jgi:hypothetical protein
MEALEPIQKFSKPVLSLSRVIKIADFIMGALLQNHTYGV